MIYEKDGVTFKCNIDIDEREADNYIQRGIEHFGSGLYSINAEIVNDDEIDIEYNHISKVPFERIRRITGYLVGNLDRFNDAKRAEEADRVKHGI